MQVMKDKINRAIKHYNYGEDTSWYDDRFMQRYNHFTDKDTLKNWSHTIYGMLSGLPNSTHIKAKKLLFQGSAALWDRYMASNPGSQRKAFDAVLDAAREIDFKHGTDITSKFWRNIYKGSFKVHP